MVTCTPNQLLENDGHHDDEKANFQSQRSFPPTGHVPYKAICMPKGYKRRTHEPGQVIVKAKAPPRPPGRPKGSRNRATLMKEEHLSKILKAAGGYLIHEVEAVLKIVVRKAKDGDMQAAKMILDRAIPVRKAEQHLPKGPASITINIQSGEVTNNGEDHKNGTTVDGWADATDGEVWDAAQGGEELAEHAGEGRE